MIKKYTITGFIVEKLLTKGFISKYRFEILEGISEGDKLIHAEMNHKNELELSFESKEGPVGAISHRTITIRDVHCE